MTTEDLEQIAAIVRRELDRKPDGWEAYAMACCAHVEYFADTDPKDFDGDRSDALYMAALKARPSRVQ